MLPGLDMYYYTYPAQPLTAAGAEVDNLDHDMYDLSTNQIDHDMYDL